MMTFSLTPKTFETSFKSLVISVFVLLSASQAYSQLYWPVSGETGSPIGQRNISYGSSNHRGLDIPLPGGTTVYAAQGGTIRFYDQPYNPATGRAGAGHYAVIDHGNGYETMYFHLSGDIATNGSTVQAGQPIALSGTSGMPPGVESYHLHFEVRRNGEAIDWDDGIPRNTSVTQGQVIPFTFSGLQGSEPVNVGQNGNEPTYTIQLCRNRSNDTKVCTRGGYDGGYNNVGDPITLTQEQVDNAANLCTNFEEVVECGGNPDEGYVSLASVNFTADPPPPSEESQGLPLCSALEARQRGRVPCEPELDRSYLDFLTPDAKNWFRRTLTFLEGQRSTGNPGPDMFKVFTGVAWAFTFALFVYAIANANYFYRNDEYWQILGRLIIAVGLITGGPAINNVLQTSWENLHDYAQQEFASSTNESLDDALKATASAIPSFILGMAAIDKINALAEDGAKGLLLDSIGELDINRQVKRIGQVLRFLLLVLMSMYGLHVVTIYSTGLVIIFAMLFLPILAALLLWPGMSSYLQRWASMVLTAFAGLVLGVLVYAMAMDLAFTIPLENLANQFSAIGTEAQSAFGSVQMQEVEGETFGQAVRRNIDAVAAGGGAVLQNGIQTLILFLFNAIFIIVGMFMGFYLLINFEGLIAGFLGGAVASGAQNLSGAASGVLGGMLASQFNSANGGGQIGKASGDALQMNASLENGSPSMSGTGRQLSLGGSSQAALPAPSSRGGPSSGGTKGGGEAIEVAAEVV